METAPTCTMVPPTTRTNHQVTIVLSSCPSPKLELSLSFNNDIYFPRFSVRELRAERNGTFVKMAQTPKIGKALLKSAAGTDVSVRMYAWKGERLVGEWDVGSYVQSWEV